MSLAAGANLPGPGDAEPALSGHTRLPLPGRPVSIPLLGYGMSHNGGYSEDALVASLRGGCRLLDTAARYGTEGHIPTAVAKAGVDYSDIFVTTKLWPQAASDPRRALGESLGRLKRESVELYLVHWPGVTSGDPAARSAKEQRAAVWRDMERLQDAGLAQSIGVSNYLESHLRELAVDPECSVVPAVNQFEVNPWQHDKGLIACCRELGVCVEGYSPLAKGRVVGDARLAALAAAYRHEGGAPVSTAQVLIRWALQHGIVTIPKTTDVGRALENRDVFDFELSDKDMKTMDAWHANLRVTWDPTGVE